MLPFAPAALLAIWTLAGPPGQHAWTVAADPIEASRVYAGTGSGAWVSEDGGATWRNVGSRSSCDDVRALTIDEIFPEHLYAGTFSGAPGACLNPGGDGLFLSDDRAATWVAQETDESIGYLRAAPTVAGRAYAGELVCTARGFFIDCRNHLYRTDDFGTTFRELASTPGGAPIFEVSPIAPQRLWCSFSGIFRSDDGGDSWLRVADPPGVIEITGAIGAGVEDRDEVLFSSDDGIFRSLDAGATWSRVSTLHATRIVFDRHRPSVAYAIINGQDVFRSPDGGLSWAPFEAGLEGVALVFDFAESADGSRLYLATGQGVFVANIPRAITPVPTPNVPLIGSGR